MPSAIYRLPRDRFEDRLLPTRPPNTGVIVVRTAPLPPFASIFGADLRAMRESLRTNAQQVRDSAEELHRYRGLDASVVTGFFDMDPEHAATLHDA